MHERDIHAPVRTEQIVDDDLADMERSDGRWAHPRNPINGRFTPTGETDLDMVEATVAGQFVGEDDDYDSHDPIDDNDPETILIAREEGNEEQELIEVEDDFCDDDFNSDADTGEDDSDIFHDRPIVLPGKYKKHNSKSFSRPDTEDRRRPQEAGQPDAPEASRE